MSIKINSVAVQRTQKKLEEIEKKINNKEFLNTLGMAIVEKMKNMVAGGRSTVVGGGIDERMPAYKSQAKSNFFKTVGRELSAEAKAFKAELLNIRSSLKSISASIKSTTDKAAKKELRLQAKSLRSKAKDLRLSRRISSGAAKSSRASANREAGSGYPASVQSKYPNKRPRPVNLFLSGQQLRNLQISVESVAEGKNKLVIGYFDSLAIKKEDGHAEGVNGQPKRPTIPTVAKGQTFAKTIISFILGEFRKELKKRIK